MWYLSRTPHPDPKTQTNSNNSIFPVSETCLFEDISIIEVTNKPDCNEEEQSRSQGISTPWEWFAYSSTLTQFHAVAVPKDMSIAKIQMLAVLPDHFLCAKVGPRPSTMCNADLCVYSRVDSTWKEIPKMKSEERNLIGAAGAIVGGWLYLAGGFEGNPSYHDPPTYLNSVERLNLKTWEWQAMQPMHQPRAFATGLAHKGKFYVVGGTTSKHSAEIYNPISKTWQFLNSYVPKQALGYAITSMYGRLFLLTWSDRLGVKLWFWTEMANQNLTGGWRLASFLPNNPVERTRFVEHGASMVRVGLEVWVLVGESSRICQVDGSGGWPIFPPPNFRVGFGPEVVQKGHIYGFSLKVGGGIRWRQIPVYSIP